MNYFFGLLKIFGVVFTNFIMFFSLKMITSNNPRETPKNIFNTFFFTRIVRYSLELDYVVFSDIVLFVMTN